MSNFRKTLFIPLIQPRGRFIENISQVSQIPPRCFVKRIWATNPESIGEAKTNRPDNRLATVLYINAVHCNVVEVHCSTLQCTLLYCTALYLVTMLAWSEGLEGNWLIDRTVATCTVWLGGLFGSCYAFLIMYLMG